jgi:hypothetical protein
LPETEKALRWIGHDIGICPAPRRRRKCSAGLQWTGAADAPHGEFERTDRIAETWPFDASDDGIRAGNAINARPPAAPPAEVIEQSGRTALIAVASPTRYRG